ncbi:unnamed protein product [Ranitomeya imitator]|uniref:Fibronectin type-III domain-containing protein n=1 Tax=Ranitomeya imitator TaxID=111125 RepID=A0ABN9L954_9NEOB|nr:unnamed protein product [Ranitomeya imitator]
MTISWLPPHSNYSHYLIELTGDLYLNETTTSESLPVSGLTPGNQYAVTIRAVTGEDVSGDFTNKIIFTRPEKVKNLIVFSVTDTSVSLSWLPPDGRTSSYLIQIQEDEKYNKITTLTEFTVQDLIPGTWYTFLVSSLTGYDTVQGDNVTTSHYTIQQNGEATRVERNGSNIFKSRRLLAKSGFHETRSDPCAGSAMRYATFAPKSRFNDAKSAISQPMKGADQESDPDETMLPHHERYTTERHGDTDEVAQEVQEELLDDPVLDPDWQPLGEQGAGGSSSEAEEEEGPQQASTSPQVPSAGPVSCPKRVAKPKPGGGQRGHPVKAQSAMPEKGLNAHIARLISLEMMPYRLVESEAFKDLMDYAVPRYELPSRHFFSRKAIPALHQHVKERIVHALRQSVSTKVHLTTDAWTSRHGQGRYVSITAHWVNVVDSGSTGDSKFGTVLPSPRSSKQLSVAVRTPSSSSSSSSCRSKSSSTDRSRTNTPSAPATVAHQVSHYGAATGIRQQAVLAMKCLGDNRHTAEVLSEFLQQETQSWLGTVDLEAGKVVSDNGRNFMAAISLSQLKHIPCLAHTLNLVVQCFLKSYPGLSDLLLKVRGLCAHIRRSPVHSSRMQTYQRSLNLPQHRLIIDVATRWNSTLHMLQRLCEQRRAVMFLWEDTHTRAGSRMADMELSGVQWSKIQDMCQVLQCFEECTRLVSADNAIISMSIPLMRLLMQSLTHIKDQASAPEEEESLDDSQRLSGQGSVHDEVPGEEEVEDEEDDGDEYIFNEEAFPGAREIGGVARPGSGFFEGHK